MDQRKIMGSPNSARNHSPIIFRLAIGVIKFLMLIYDLISLPVYYFLQRPDRRRQAAYTIKSERVDDNTWIKTTQTTNYSNWSCAIGHDNQSQKYNSSNYYTFNRNISGRGKVKYNFKGSTLNEIFAKSVIEYHDRPCLGYRALITCPVIAYDNHGKQKLQEKSFRSDFTWYTYEQVGRRVQDIASGLYSYSIYPESKALILGDTSLEWFIAAQACFQLGVQLVLAPHISDIKILTLILQEAEVNTIFVSCSRLSIITKLYESIRRIQDQTINNSQQQDKVGPYSIIKVKYIILIDWQFTIDFDEPVFSKLKQVTQSQIETILSMGKIEERGVENPIQMNCTPQSEPNRAGNSSDLPLDQSMLLFDGKNNSCPTRRRTPTDFGDMMNENLLKNRNNLKWNRKINRAYGNNAKNTMASIRNPLPGDIAMIVYTYGSVAQLKAVMLTHECIARCNHYSFLDGLIEGDDIHCAVLPLDNLFEFVIEMCIFSQGASIGYSCGPNTLFYDGRDLFGKRDRSDLVALKPTFLATKPFMLERFRGSINSYISDKMNPIMSYLLTNVIYDYKKYWAKNYYQTPLVDRIFCSRLGALFGSRIQYIFCHGATACSETKDFFAFMVNIPIIELYGQTESIVSMMSSIDIWDFHESHHSKQYEFMKASLLVHQLQGPQPDFQQIQLMPPTNNSNLLIRDCSKNLLITSSVLCPTQKMRIRLEDWEDFRTTDLPYPRGRLVVGGDIVSDGYYKRPKLTNKLFYVDSNLITWFRTEDVAQALPNGTFEIISRISDLIKMVDGHFISLGQVEQVLRNSQFVDNVCAVCCEERKFLIALVVPDLRRLALKSPGADDIKMAIGIGGPEPDELNDIEFRREVCNDRLLCEFVNRHLSELVAKAGLQAIPKRFHLVAEIWTPESELVTPSLKPSRRSIEKFYAGEIQSIFKTEFTPSSLRRHQILTKMKSRHNAMNLINNGSINSSLSGFSTGGNSRNSSLEKLFSTTTTTTNNNNLFLSTNKNDRVSV